MKLAADSDNLVSTDDISLLHVSLSLQVLSSEAIGLMKRNRQAEGKNRGSDGKDHGVPEENRLINHRRTFSDRVRPHGEPDEDSGDGGDGGDGVADNVLHCSLSFLLLGDFSAGISPGWLFGYLIFLPKKNWANVSSR